MQYARWAPSIPCIAYKIVTYQTHRSFWHVLYAHRGMDQNFDLVGVSALNAARSRYFICSNRAHAACGYVTPRNLLPMRFSACQTWSRILHLYIWRRKSARHYSIFPSNSNRWHFALLSTMLANRPCNSGVKSSPELFFSANTCVCIFVLVRQILYQQT